jgi:aminoglycoside phosphotransferase family enzyme
VPTQINPSYAIEQKDLLPASSRERQALTFLQTSGNAVDLSWEQQEVIEFLSHGESYGLPDEAVERIVTHGAIVFLLKDRAYKLKRAIRFASLDYTTARLRRQACYAELRLNKRTAPRLYLDVWTITRDRNGILVFNGTGPVVEHVVVMRRFAQSHQFDVLAERGYLSRQLISRLGAEIARFHGAARPSRAFGGAQGIRWAIAENFRELERLAPFLKKSAVSALRGEITATFHRLMPVLEQRRNRGLVRRGHGDLRLANVCLFEGKPTLFDCIEFSDPLAWTDVLYDLAFLLIDLDLRGYSDLAALALKRYREIAGNADDLQVLPLFLALRAAARSWTLAGSALRRQDPHEARSRLQRALTFLAASHRYLVTQSAWLHQAIDQTQGI